MLEWKNFPDPVSEADWAELSCFTKNSPTLSGSEIIQFLNRQMSEENAATVLEDIREQINWRETQLRDLYPFELSQGAIVRRTRWKDVLPYTFMLLLSFHEHYEETRIKRWNKVAKMFERLVTVSIREHLGNAIRIGSPRTPPESPRSFLECIPHLCAITGEKKGTIPKMPWHKDAGVDVIGWKKLDERPGKVIFLVQCAAGGNWRRKDRVKLRRWSRMIYFATNPIEVLAFPQVYNIQNQLAEETWIDECEGRLLLDRLRLATFNAGSLPADLRKEILEWSGAQMDKLQP